MQIHIIKISKPIKSTTKPYCIECGQKMYRVLVTLHGGKPEWISMCLHELSIPDSVFE